MVVAEAARRDLAKTVAATGTVPWLSALLTCRPQQARQVCRLGEDLDGGLDQTRAAFAAGEVNAAQAQVIATAVHALPDDIGVDGRAQAERVMLGEADRYHAGVLAALGSTLLDRIAPDLAETRLGEQLARAEARDTDRHNSLGGSLDHRGRIRIRGELDCESWALLAAALEPLAKPTPLQHPDGTVDRDDRTVGNRYADALVELARRAMTSNQLPTHGGYPAQLTITIDHHSLVTGIGAGLLDTGTPLSARAVRRIACDATVLPVLLGTDSIPLDAGRAARVFTKELRKAVELRDIGCTFPAAHGLQPGPRSTTSPTGSTADPRPWTTASSSADTTTALCTATNGPSGSGSIDDPNTPHHHGSTPINDPSATPSTSDCEVPGLTIQQCRSPAGVCGEPPRAARVLCQTPDT